eukprot:m.20718 g.20718  ORF g.20718 m.20718 type:complete len:577 (+) comp8195_c2_seq1:691-2421(+)
MSMSSDVVSAPSVASSVRAMRTSDSSLASATSTTSTVSDTELYAGYLIKSPPIQRVDQLSVRRWRQRYFVLYSNKRLEYWNDESRTTLKGQIDLGTCWGVKPNMKHKKYQYVFSISTEMREYFLVAGSEVTMMNWVKLLEEVMKSPARTASFYVSRGLKIRSSSLLQRVEESSSSDEDEAEDELFRRNTVPSTRPSQSSIRLSQTDAIKMEPSVLRATFNGCPVVLHLCYPSFEVHDAATENMVMSAFIPQILSYQQLGNELIMDIEDKATGIMCERVFIIDGDQNAEVVLDTMRSLYDKSRRPPPKESAPPRPPKSTKAATPETALHVPTMYAELAFHDGGVMVGGTTVSLSTILDESRSSSDSDGEESTTRIDTQSKDAGSDAEFGFGSMEDTVTMPAPDASVTEVELDGGVALTTIDESRTVALLDALAGKGPAYPRSRRTRHDCIGCEPARYKSYKTSGRTHPRRESRRTPGTANVLNTSGSGSAPSTPQANAAASVLETVQELYEMVQVRGPNHGSAPARPRVRRSDRFSSSSETDILAVVPSSPHTDAEGTSSSPYSQVRFEGGIGSVNV